MPPELALRLRRLWRRALALPRRAYLTLRYHGARELAFRLVTFPLRLTPLGPRLGLVSASDPTAPARRWYREHGRRVTVVIPTYGDPGVVEQAIRSVRRTTARERVRLIVADDGSAAEHQEGLRALAGQHGVELILGDAQRGFAANCNRGLRAAAPDEDIVLLNSDVIAHPGWLEALQHAAYEAPASIVGGRLLYPDGTIQFGGGLRNPHAPEWFDHRFRGRDGRLAEANVRLPVLTVTGACMYVTRATLDDLGLLDESYEMAFEDADYCVRAWDRGHRVLYEPAAALTHHESKTRGIVQGARELRSQAHFWARWGDWFDARDVHAPGGGLRIVYVASEAGDAELAAHVDGLRERGHDARLIMGGAGLEELETLDAIKVATDWQAAELVWERSVRCGVPAYLVRDLDLVRRHGRGAARVLAGLRPEFAYLAASDAIAGQLRELATRVVVVAPGRLDELERAYRGLATERADGMSRSVHGRRPH